MKRIVWIIVLLYSSLLWSNGWIKGSGRFVAQEGEKLGFIKQQLLYQATRDIITKELTNMHLDAELFWEKFDQAFIESFRPIEDNLKSKFKIEQQEDLSNLTARQRELYFKQLRHKKLVAQIRFGQLKKVLRSFVIKRMSHSASQSNIYHIRLMAKVNRKLLNKLYIKYTRELSGLLFKRLYLVTDFVMQDLAWPDIGVTDVSAFKSAVDRNWAKWLEGRLSQLVEQVVVSDPQLSSRVQRFYQEQGAADEEFKNGLMLKIDMQIRRREISTVFSRLKYQLRARLNLFDLESKKIIYFADIPLRDFSVELGDDFKVSSEVATAAYNFLIERFIKLSQFLQSYEQKKTKVLISVSKVKSVQDIFLLKQFLENMTINLGTQIEVAKYKVSEQQVNLVARMRSSIEQFTQLFLSLNQRELTPQIIMQTNVDGGKFNLTLQYRDITEKK